MMLEKEKCSICKENKKKEEDLPRSTRKEGKNVFAKFNNFKVLWLGEEIGRIGNYRLGIQKED